MNSLPSPTAAATDAYELVVGLETHVQLATASKMFCACAANDTVAASDTVAADDSVAADAAAPNTRTCPVCLGLPGSLPAPNAQAIALAVRAGLSLGCRVHPRTWFERKNYHYPDLPKGYQISQYARPLCTGGALVIEVGDRAVTVRIERLHLEEDTGKLTHVPGGTLVDFNRAGVPLVEIVTRPDMRSPDEAAAYVEALRHHLRWIGVSTAVMAAGALRVDVNCSVRRRGEEAFGTKVEIKNLNSIAAVRSALAFERERQIRCLQSGEPIAHETRGWLEGAGRTVSQRAKELAHDYRYFPEPDLPPLVLDGAWIDAMGRELPELPAARRARLVDRFALRPSEARLLTRDRATADYFEAAAAASRGSAQAVAQWITGPLFGALNARGEGTGDAAMRLPPAHLAGLVALVDAGTVTPAVGKDVLARMIETGEDARALVDRGGLARIDDDAVLRDVVAGVLAANPKAVADFRGGKTATLAFLIGGVMKATRGQAGAEAVRRLLLEALEGQS